MDVSTGGMPKPPTLQTLKSLEDPQRRSRVAPAAVDGTREVLVWWDIEACPLPAGWTCSAPASLLRELQCVGDCKHDIRVTINVYGNGGPGSKAALDSLIASGITLQHRILPCKLPGSETAAVKTMMVDLSLWALSNPAPRDVFLISTVPDSSFRDLISGLHMREYDIHLATKFSLGSTETYSGDDGHPPVQRDHHHPRRLFNPMPRRWSASKQTFVVRTARDPVQLAEDIKAQVHLDNSD